MVPSVGTRWGHSNIQPELGDASNIGRLDDECRLAKGTYRLVELIELTVVLRVYRNVRVRHATH
jgi:hypothetical protein